MIITVKPNAVQIQRMSSPQDSQGQIPGDELAGL